MTNITLYGSEWEEIGYKEYYDSSNDNGFMRIMANEELPKYYKKIKSLKESGDSSSPLAQANGRVNSSDTNSPQTKPESKMEVATDSTPLKTPSFADGGGNSGVGQKQDTNNPMTKPERRDRQYKDIPCEMETPKCVSFARQITANMSISGTNINKIISKDYLVNIINLNDYEHVDSKEYAGYSGERIIRWKDRKQLYYIKKEDKFPKEFKDSEYTIEVDKNWIDIFLQGEIWRFASLGSLPLLIQAVEYWMENKNEM